MTNDDTKEAADLLALLPKMLHPEPLDEARLEYLLDRNGW